MLLRGFQLLNCLREQLRGGEEIITEEKKTHVVIIDLTNDKGKN
jgi:hypothetical protein